MANGLINALIQDIIRMPWPLFFLLMGVGCIASYRIFGSGLGLVYRFTYGKRTDFKKYGAGSGGWGELVSKILGCGTFPAVCKMAHYLCMTRARPSKQPSSLARPTASA